MRSEKIIREAQLLNPTALLELFEIDATNLGVPQVLRFYNGSNAVTQTVVFQGNAYNAFPIEITNFEFKVQGELPRPTLRVANVASTITALVLNYGDLVGAKVTRHRTFARYLDTQPSGAANPDADPNAEFPPDIYYIEQKTGENKLMVTFELATSLDVDNVMLPRRVITANTCSWVYRGPDCGFANNDYIADSDNKNITPTRTYRGPYSSSVTYTYGDVVKVTPSAGIASYYVFISVSASSGIAPPNPAYWMQDVCSKRLSGCKLRFDPAGQGNSLPFGAFPGTDNLPSV